MEDKAVKIFLDSDMDSPGAAMGLTAAALVASGKMHKEDPAEVALFRSIILATVHVAAMQAQLTACLASSSSAKLATVLKPTAPGVDYKAKLIAGGMPNWPFVAVEDQTIWDKLFADSEAAKLAGRTALTYFDLTVGELSPLRLTPEATGEKVGADGALGDASSLISKLGDLQRALKGAMENNRLFWTYAQWVACSLCFASATVATGQWSWDAVILHQVVIALICEKKRATGRQPFAAVVYDDLLRNKMTKGNSATDMPLPTRSLSICAWSGCSRDVWVWCGLCHSAYCQGHWQADNSLCHSCTATAAHQRRIKASRISRIVAWSLRCRESAESETSREVIR